MERREYNPWTGIETVFRSVPGQPGKIQILQRQRCDDVLDSLQRRRSMGATESPYGRHMGSIPTGLALQWQQEDGVTLWKMHPKERMAYWRRKLNDGDYSKLRVAGGQI